MTNFEKFKSEIAEIIALSHNTPAVKDGRVVACKSLSCSECTFDKHHSCGVSFIEWLYEDDGELKGCDGCKYEYKKEDESPCTDCCNNYTSKWEHRPKKTRQDEFLEMFPNAELIDSIISICPKFIDGDSDRCKKYAKIPCIECHKDYWLQEVEE